ncbi:MAG: hypothetical protein DRP09_10360 [Candidatus Thorarchaeota archaeon]|nr:MAG: hypothetical protein DRP09_10360 [Candidatus Thorarchaeota archaeon]
MPTDQENILQWQKTNDPQLFADLVVRYQPVVNKVVNQYRTVGVSPATLRAEATTQLIKSFKSYDPKHGTQPTTHVWNNLKKVQRVASESLQSGHIPENRALKRSTFTIVRDNLEDRLGREASVEEIADEIGWNKKEVARMSHELGGEATASKASFDFYGNAVTKEHPDKALFDYMYMDVSGPEKVILEHTFGYGGKPILNNKEIAAKLNKNEMWVHRAKQRLSDRVKSYR